MKIRVVYLYTNPDIDVVLYSDIAATVKNRSRDSDPIPNYQLCLFANRREHCAMSDPSQILINLIVYRDIRTKLYA
jgi:hypothetical protein